VATVELNRDNFKQTVDDNGVVLVDFWAEWCGPCRMFAPIYEEVSERYPGVVFGKINTEIERELAQMFGIRSIPTLMIFGSRSSSSHSRVPCRARPWRTSSRRLRRST